MAAGEESDVEAILDLTGSQLRSWEDIPLTPNLTVRPPRGFPRIL